ncbi:cystine-binding periplasmic protein FliY [Gottschalkia purinilytica]|uniref:Cystine-binding periplasmic protein FliY n=1 Tax=Gottschalkia purinilytica TaxID=1503 RepID=A0A0L0WA85_GOTPU|nr:amino acid ABC transporter substrate-binding protein [Gottschalkia purinilytica]KNF08205.1 cystine-binding periplasmic protein FliY [Gottschalkia purinilytica]
MKKGIIALIISILLISLLFTGCGSKETSGKADDSLNKIKESGKFVVGLDDSFPPMGFRDDKGEIIGFDIDLAKEVAKRMGVKAEFKPVEWKGVTLTLKKGDIDLIWNAFTKTEDRKKQVNFSDTYLANKQILVVKKGSSIKTKEDLKGKILGLQMGSTAEDALKKNKEVSDVLKDVKKYSNNVEALMDLSAGRIEVLLVDEVVGKYYLKKKPGEYEILKDYLEKEEYGVGIRKEDKALLKELNKILAEMKADGTTDKISNEWFGEDQ